MALKIETLDQVLKKKLTNSTFKKEWDALQPQYELIRAVIEARIQSGLTQKQLAAKLKTKQSSISRFKSGRSLPSVSFLVKMAQALNRELRISLH